MNIKFENLHTLVTCEYPAVPCGLLSLSWGQIPQPVVRPQAAKKYETLPNITPSPGGEGWGEGGRLSKIFVSYSNETAETSISFSCRNRFKRSGDLGRFNHRFDNKRFN